MQIPDSPSFLGFSVLVLSITIFLVQRGWSYLDSSQLLMPKEYKTLKRVVKKLALKNDLGDQPLTFTIVTGSRAYWAAKALALCEETAWGFYRNINPYQTYHGKGAEEINEVIRQSYLLNGIEAYAYSNGTIAITRSTFRSHTNSEDYLAFVIGHELSHVLNHDSFNHSLRKAKEGKKLKKKKKELLGYRISRENETNADINSAKMIINAGYPKDTCLKAFEFHARHEGYGQDTQKDSTHPGYEDRREALVKFLETFNESDVAKRSRETKGNWSYSRELNTLTFKCLNLVSKDVE